MSEKPWTPGPYKSSGNAVFAQNDDGTDRVFAMVQPGFLRADGGATDAEETIRTAYLFAAADELYDELEVRLAQTRCGCGHTACKRCEADAETERVLAKARGEEQG